MAENKNAVVYCEPVMWNDSNIRLSPVLINNEPHFVAVEVCNLLDLKNPSKALLSLDDDEKLMSVITTSGQGRQMWLVNESGFYHLVLISRKPQAIAIRKWVTSEVLPSIRKMGKYKLSAKFRPYVGGYLDLHSEPYDTRFFGGMTVRVVEYKNVEWYSIADILRGMQVGTCTSQAAKMLSKTNTHLVCKILIFGNPHPAWFTTANGLRLLISGSRKLRTRGITLQLQKGGEL